MKQVLGNTLCLFALLLGTVPCRAVDDLCAPRKPCGYRSIEDAYKCDDGSRCKYFWRPACKEACWLLKCCKSRCQQPKPKCCDPCAEFCRKGKGFFARLWERLGGNTKCAADCCVSDSCSDQPCKSSFWKKLNLRWQAPACCAAGQDCCRSRRGGKPECSAGSCGSGCSSCPGGACGKATASSPLPAPSALPAQPPPSDPAPAPAAAPAAIPKPLPRGEAIAAPQDPF